MKCDAFWGLADSPPHKYIVEFSKEEVDNLMKGYSHRGGNAFRSPFSLGWDVFDVLAEEYKKYNKDSK